MANKELRDLGPMIITNKNSPLVDNEEEDKKTVGPNGKGFCWFNGTQFGNGDEICSDGEKLVCTANGNWLKKGKC